ncbi:hypothetical protein ACFL2C_00210 [Patescibacteria group bacterium]
MILLFLLLILIGPRFATVVWWLFSPEGFSFAFSSLLMPVLGLIFLPWTTLMYVSVFPGGLGGFDWLFLILAFAADMGSYATGGYKATRRSVSSKDTGTPKVEESQEESIDEE